MKIQARRNRSRAAKSQAGAGPKMARLEARIRADQKHLIERAAAVRGVTVTDFVIGTVHEAATRTVHEHEVMLLGREDRARFVEALLNPPSPSPALRGAAERHKKMLES